MQTPTINDDDQGFRILFGLWQHLQSLQLGGTPTFSETVLFDFSSCGFLQQNAVAFLGGMALYVDREGGKPEFDWDSLRADVRKNLAQNGFMKAFGHAQPPWEGNSIPYKAAILHDPKSMVSFLREKWLGRDWIAVTDQVRNGIVGSVLEIYNNAFEHSRSPIGITICGQRYPNLGRLALTIVDFGVGIPGNVRSYQGNKALTAEDALRWAFSRGTTTVANPPTSRGLGLHLLKEFVTQNDGRLVVYSGSARCTIELQLEDFSGSAFGFMGTVVNISVACDETCYNRRSIDMDAQF